MWGAQGPPSAVGQDNPTLQPGAARVNARALLAACALANLATGPTGGWGCPRARPSPWSRAWAPWLECAECPGQGWDRGWKGSAPYTSEQLSQGDGLCGIPTREVS